MSLFIDKYKIKNGVYFKKEVYKMIENNMVIKDRQRNLYLDVIKGLTILFVLWGHSIQYFTVDEFDFFENSTFKFIYSFHMPLFMLVSGYLFYYSQRKRTLIQTIKGRIINTGIPIVIWNTIYYVVELSINKLQGNKVNISFFSWLQSLRGLWFLWSVLAASIVVTVICTIYKGKLQIVLLIFGITCMVVFPNKNMNLFMYPYFITGFLFNIYKEKINRKLLNFKYISLILFPVLMIFYKKECYIYTSGINPLSSEYGVTAQISIDIFRWLVGFVGCIFILCIVEIFMRKVELSKVLKVIINFIAKLGVLSLHIYVMQRILLEYIVSKYYDLFIKKIGYNILAENIILYNFVITPLIALIFAVVLGLIAESINKNKRVNLVLFGR